MSNKQSPYVQTELILLLMFFLIISLAAIYNAQQLPQAEGENFVLKQAVWYSIGIFLIAGMQFFDLEQLGKASIYIYGFGVFLLAAVLVAPDSIAPVIKGTKGWFQLPGISVQPAELAKISTFLYLAAIISRHKEKYEASTFKSDCYLLLKLILVTVLPVLLIMMQPDFGTSMVYIFIMGVMIILSGISWRIIAGLVLGVSVFAGAALTLIVKFPDIAKNYLMMKNYQIDRIMTWFDPSKQGSSETYQSDLSQLAIGSGQLFGKGIKGIQVQRLPEAHTDFVFSIIGESFGFIGSAFVVFLYFMLLYKLVTLGLNISKQSHFGSYLCFGYLSYIFVHIFENIGMTIGIMPITGIPLLLISYGGSSVMAALIGFGLIYRVAVEQSIYNDYLFK